MTEAYWILGGLLATVLAASAIGQLLARRQPLSPSIKNLNARIRSWWILIVVGGAALLAGRLAIIALFGFVSFLALGEFLNFGRRLDVRSAICYGILLVHYGFIAAGWTWAFLIFIPVAGGLASFSPRARQTVWGLLLAVYCISHIPALMLLKIPHYEGRAPLLPAFAVMIVQTSDVLQYVWGKLLGRHPVAPKISPSKTVEGLLGGVLSATLLGAALSPITPWGPWQAGVMALMIAALGFLGGLLMSAIKRRRGIKDWGSLLQGHGGMLDRVDSLCLSAPMFFHVTRYFFNHNA